MYLKDLKFSLWADFIERDYLDGEFKELVGQGIVNGATSNPAIFKNAILTSDAYKEQLLSLNHLTVKQKYEALAIFDIQKAADVLKPLYDVGDDGYVSIEIDPMLCDDTKESIQEGERLYSEIDRENVMIKVPATTAGYEVMEVLISKGIAVNATLVFKKSQALACMDAFERGLKNCEKKVDSVISIFVSRVDRALDDKLQDCGIERSLSGIYNSANIYSEIVKRDIDGCRALFASTGVKDDSLPPCYYIDNLLAYNTVNTAPIDTIKSFNTNGKKQKSLPFEDGVIEKHFKKISDASIDFEKVLDKQIADGLEAFKVAFREILESI